MSTTVFLAVLLAACLHAIWNSMVKGSDDKHATMLAVVLGHIPVAILVLPFAPPVSMAAIPWIIGGVALHLGYQLFPIAGYRAGDLTLVYPIARGSAPLIVTAVSIGVMGVSFTNFELSRVVLIALGLVSLALVRRADETRNSRAVKMAVCTGAFIAAYSLVDGLVIWAFTQAPVALVTALRETSIVFALLIGVSVLKERLDFAKVISTFVTILGAILLRASKS